MVPPPSRVRTFVLTVIEASGQQREVRHVAEACRQLGSDYVLVDPQGAEVARYPVAKVQEIKTA